MVKIPTDANTAPGYRWDVAGASIQGISHTKCKLPCQDAHLWREGPKGSLVLAVADGAGSASLSQVGAARAVIAAVEWVVELLKDDWPRNNDDWRAMLTASLQTAHDSVIASAEKRKVSPRELATTLIVVVATPTGVAAAQIGDGAAVVLTEDRQLRALTIPQSGECINETSFFTAPDYLEAAQFVYQEGPVAGVAALSDGLQMLALKMPGGEPYPAFFLPLFDMVRETEDLWRTEDRLRAFLQSDRITLRADDDLTLVLGILGRNT